MSEGKNKNRKRGRGAKSFESAMRKEPMRIKALKSFDFKICDSCLGRQFGTVSTGMTNEFRGKIIRKILEQKPLKGRCEICNGLFQGGIEKLAKKAIKKLEKIEYSTFVVGTRLDQNLISLEEKIWAVFGIAYCEQIKTEINRETGKIISKNTRKEVDELHPDVNILLDLCNSKIKIIKHPVLFYGEYNKLVRGIPQTKWDKYKISVEDIIAKPIMKKTKGISHKMHGAGREDIDAICLGWRPFVIEISEPKKRKINLLEMQKAINRSKKVKIKNLRRSDKKEVAKIKGAKYLKTYRMIVQFEKVIDDVDLRILKGLVGVVKQKTPQRVIHRRADRIRMRNVLKLGYKKLTNKKITLEIKGEAGLYVKELVSGDNGRTTPSVFALMENPAKVITLDVIKIHKR